MTGSNAPAEHRARLLRIAAAIAPFAVTGLVYLPALGVPLWYDDQMLLEDVARVRLGEVGFLEQIFTPHNEHSMPLVRLLYHGAWRAFGLAPAPWHAGVLAVHATSALLLGILLRRYLGSPGAALLGSVLFAGAALGGWESPLVWVGSSQVVFSLFGLLLAMVGVTRIGSPYPAAGITAVAAGMTISVASTGGYVLLAPLVPLQAVLLEGSGLRGAGARARAAWLAAFLVPVLPLGMLGAAVGRTVAPTFADPADLAARALHILLTTVGALVYRVRPGGMPPVLPGLVVAVVLARAAFVLRRELRLRFVGLLASGALVLTAAAVVARSAWPAEMVLSWGRYRHVPTLAAAAFVAALAGAVLARAGSRRPTVALLLVLFAGVALSEQAWTVRGSVGSLESSTAGYQLRVASLRRTMRALGTPPAPFADALVCPDATLRVGLVDHTLAHFRAFAEPGLSGVTFLSAARVTAEQRERCLAALHAIPEIAAREIELRMTGEH